MAASIGEQTFSDVEEEDSLTSSEHGDTAPQQLDVGKKETRAVFLLRLLVLSILTAITGLVSYFVYYFGNEAEVETFERQFEAHATKVVGGFETGAGRRLQAFDELALTMTTHAQATNSSWPFVTLNEFERRAGMTLDLSEAVSIMFCPVVQEEHRAKWRNYSWDNQGWIDEGLLIQEQNGIPVTHFEREAAKQTVGAQSRDLFPELDSIATEIFDIEGYTGFPETRSGPFYPIWQLAPAIPFKYMVNANIFRRSMNYLLETRKSFVTKSFDFSREAASIEESGAILILGFFLARHEETYVRGPACELFVPVYDGFDDDKSIVGGFQVFVHWQRYFEKVLPENANGVICVLENTQNQTYTFEINGPEVTYVGEGDYHDDNYDHMKVVTPFGFFMGREDEDMEKPATSYRIRVYPSDTMKNEHLSSLPKHFALILAATFVFTVGVFVVYDFIVERRQRLVVSEAIKTGTVVNSLFPETVLDRLYDTKSVGKTSRKDFKRTNSLGDSEDSYGHQSMSSERNKVLSLPIADLYPDCTVLFADIKGFTKWSSKREPVEVFTLLETIYGSFDKSAKKLKVFKIETIGDCYLAVTGIPEPQEDHALIMARFAVLLDTKMNQLVHQLVGQLGDDTRTLQMRVGLHSGPVTAGVLRGEKARFQLFGDTVNTASRMESTGDGGRIQVSQETADLLIAGGKQHWIQPRETLVEAKGKGSLQTYWLLKQEFSSFDTMSARTSMSHLQMTEPEEPDLEKPELVTDGMVDTSNRSAISL